MDVLTLRALLTLDKTDYDRGLNEADSNASKFGSGFKSKMGKAAKAGAVALGAFAVSSVKVGADFDKSMSQVAATMGYTVEELHTQGSQAQKDYEALEKTARDLGKTTKFSAQEAAEGLNYMALAGYDVATSQRMLPQVLNLAAAGDMDLARASDMVTDAQSALGLSIGETESMVDQMAKTASLTNTNVEQLGDAFLTVGGTAKMMKSETESAQHATAEASAALGVLASAGIKGSEGGTALRNVLQGITKSKFQKTFGEIGVSAYDAKGELRDLPDILTDMNTAMEGMTTEEKNDLISKTFNVRDLKSVNALLAKTPKEWDELTASIMDSKGAAAAMAETQLDNLSGDVTILKSAFSELQITVSDLDHGALRTFVQGVTEGINTVTEMLNAESLNEAFDILGEKFNQFDEFVTEGLGNAIEAVQSNLPQLISTLMNGLMSFSGTFRERAGNFISMGLDLIKAIAKGIIDNIPTFIQTIPTIITNFAGVINDNAPKIITTGLQIVKYLIVGIIKAIPTLIANIPKIIQAMVSVFVAFNWAGLGSKVIRSVGRGIAKAAGALKSAVIKPVNAVRTFIAAGFLAAKNKATSLMESLKDGVKKKIDGAKEAVKGAVDKIKGLFPLSIGKLFSNLQLPHISASGGKAPFGLLGKGTPPKFSVSWYRKAEDVPYLFTNPSIAMAGEGPVDELMYGKKNLMRDIEEVTSGTRSVMNNYFTINDASDPDEVANYIVRKLQLEMRTA